MERSHFPGQDWPPKRIALLLFCAVLVLYLPSLANGFIWDDDAYVTNNRTLWVPGGLERIWTVAQASPQYYPLVFSTFWIEHALWGFHPFGYHLVNLCLHAANAVWVWWLLRRLRVPGAALAGLLFAIHPVQVETAGWISERKNLLSAFFYFAALAGYWRWHETRERGAADWRGYGVALFCFVLALFSKTVACSLPAAILLLIWWKRGRLVPADAGWLAPFFALGLALGLHTAWLERVHVGAQGSDWAFSWGMHAWIAGRAVLFYLAKLAWPHPLVFIYPRWSTDPSLAVQWGAAALVFLLAAGLWLARRRVGRGPLAAFLFFLLTLFPALGFLNLFPMRYSFVADHFQYLACVGPLALFAAALTRAGERFRWSRRAWALVLAVLLVPLAAKTFVQQANYQDAFTLSQSIVRRNPDSWIAHRNVGDGLAERGAWPEALAEYNRADALHPDDLPLRSARGVLLEKMGDFPGAGRDFAAALALDPGSALAQNSMGGLLARQKRWTEAQPYFEKAISLDPDLLPGHYNLAVTCYYLGDLDRSLREYGIALRLDPTFQPARIGLATALQARRAALSSPASK